MRRDEDRLNIGAASGTNSHTEEARRVVFWRSHVLRKMHGEERAVSDFRGYSNISAVGLGDSLHKTQAEPEALFRSAPVTAEEAIPYLRKVLGRDADAGIPYGDENLLLLQGGLNIDSSFWRSIF
jgi:hypothetical protein